MDINRARINMKATHDFLIDLKKSLYMMGFDRAADNLGVVIYGPLAQAIVDMEK
jgi:hypothetical protein